jgi:hypothetical protein
MKLISIPSLLLSALCCQAEVITIDFNTAGDLDKYFSGPSGFLINETMGGLNGNRGCPLKTN